ncbi:transcription factor SPT20 -like protein [Brachionus plicatilis]|uniref:Transcription factor SPT20-like protein n=1 Tax=Brachionus plicatilis TaxID=10195 RepID=A0A3M7PUR3_BRAPC|nr:transcription factor SPT20 -like protein [Brachionus plicatilis]
MFDSFEDDEYEEKANRVHSKRFSQIVEYEPDEPNYQDKLSQREKHILESDNKLVFYNSSSGDQLAKKKLEMYLYRPSHVFYSNAPTSSSPSPQSLKQRLIHLYLEENKRQFSESKYVNYSTNLLKKLVNRENLNTLVLNLYPENEGYSFGFNLKLNSYFEEKINLNKLETKLVSYEEADLFFYINTGEIPPILIDLVDHMNTNLFYDGCIVLEIRDYRRRKALTAANSIKYDLNYVLLQPSVQTLLADINSMTKSGNCVWTQEDIYALESQLLLATSAPLCLQPSPLVSIIKSKILSYKYRLSNRNLIKMSSRHSEISRLRALKWHEYDLPYPFRILKVRKKYSNQNSNYLSNQCIIKNEIILNGISKLSDEQSGSSASNIEDSKDCDEIKPVIELPSQDSILVKRFSKCPEQTRYTLEPNLIPIEELVLEAEDKSSKNNYSKLVILRQTNDGAYYCKLSLRNDQKNQISFRLGSASDAEKYIQQYVKIFTEEGRRQVNLKHNLIEKPVENKPNYSALKKPTNTSLVQTGLSFQNISPTQNLNDKQLQSYQTFLHKNFHQQRSHLEQLKRSRSSSTEDSNSNLKTLVTQPSTNQKIYANIRNLAQSSPILQTSPHVVAFNQKCDKTEAQNGTVQSQKMAANSLSTSFATTSSAIANNNVVQVLLPKMAQTSQQEKKFPTEQSPALVAAVNETQVNKKSPKTPKTPAKRQTKKRTNSTTSQSQIAPKSSTNDTNGDQNFKPTSTKIINASSLFKKIAIDNRPMIVTLNSESNKMVPKKADDSAQNASSPIKTTTVQFLQKSTPVISLNSTQNKIYSHEMTNSLNSVNSPPVKKLNQEQTKQPNEPIYITSPSGIKTIQSRPNYIFPSTVKTIPINSKTSQQYFPSGASLENHSLFNKSLNSSQQTTSVIMLTNNSNTNTPKSN